MKWFENLWHRSVWKLRRVLRLKDQTIAPIQWDKPLLTSHPGQSLLANLDDEQRRRLQLIVEESRVISMLTRHFPSRVTDHDWKTLLECQTRKQRFQHLKFLRTRELERAKDLQKKQLKTRPPLQQPKQEAPEFSPFYFPHAKLAKDERRAAWQRVARAYRCCEPTLAVDCRFLPLLSPRGAELTAMQLKYLISDNRDSRDPWQLYFTNFDCSIDRIRRIKEKHLLVVDSSATCGPVISPQNLGDLFARDRVVYLSPDAEEEMEDVEQDEVYVLGGIVDRVVERGIPRQASLQTALAEGVRCKKLPLDRYVEWKSGTKYLTLTAVSSILRNVYSSGGDWEMALRKNIPVRNVRSADEKSPVGRQLHDKIRRFDNHLLQILEREIGQEALMKTGSSGNEVEH